MSNQSRSLISQFEHIASSANDLSQVNAFIQMCPRPPRHVRFRQAIVFHKGDLSVHIEKRLSWWYPQLRRINSEIPAYRLEVEHGRVDPRKTVGVFVVLPGNAPNFYRIITLSYSTFWRNAIEKLLKSIYPGATPIFFKQDEMRRALVAYQHHLGPKFNVLLVEMTMKRKVTEDTLSPAGYIETDRVWTELNINDAFDQALEGRYLFTGIKFSVLKERDRSRGYSKVANGRLYKSGSVNYDFLQSEFNESAMKVLELAAAERLQFLSKRGTRERNYHPSKPIQIEYQRDVFSDTSEVIRFGAAIASYPKSTRAVFHANPYYHASVADFEDGSSMEIWILSPRRVLISPQAKSSAEALQRIISHIFFEFQEGEISEYVE